MAFEVEIDGVHVKVTPLADVELRKGMGGSASSGADAGWERSESPVGTWRRLEVRALSPP